MNQQHQHQPSLNVECQPRQVHTITDRFDMMNTYIIDADPLIVVDPGSELNVRLACKYIGRFLHRSLSDIGLIVLTHLHLDHISGLRTLLEICKVPVAASSVIKHLAQSQAGMRGLHSLSQVAPRTFHQLDIFPPAYAQQVGLIDIWLDDVAGLPTHPDWRVITSPGHTLESICLYNPFSAELLSGDTLITVERGRPLLRNGVNRLQLEQTLLTLKSLRVHYLYPGHGRPILSQSSLAHVYVEWR